MTEQEPKETNQQQQPQQQPQQQQPQQQQENQKEQKEQAQWIYVAAGFVGGVAGVYSSEALARRRDCGVVYKVLLDSDVIPAPISRNGHDWQASPCKMFGVAVSCRSCELQYSEVTESSQCLGPTSPAVILRERRQATKQQQDQHREYVEERIAHAKRRRAGESSWTL